VLDLGGRKITLFFWEMRSEIEDARCRALVAGEKPAGEMVKKGAGGGSIRRTEEAVSAGYGRTRRL